MNYFELNDLFFFISNLQNPPMNFSMLNCVSFSSASTRSAAHGKLTHAKFSSNLNHFHYFNRLPRLWNSLPSINLSESFPTIKSKIKSFLWSTFQANFNPSIPCSYHFLCPCRACSSMPHPSHFYDLTN